MHYLLYSVTSLTSISTSFSLSSIAYIYKKKYQSIFKQRVTDKKDKITPTKLVFYEHQREAFEIKIGETTESMLNLLSELKQQNTSSLEI